MKKLLLILAILPLMVNAQLTPDSLYGCYAGTYKQWAEYDVNWAAEYTDTIIIFKVDTVQVNVGGTIKDMIALGWLLKNPASGYNFSNGFRSFCNYGYTFKQCPWGFDTMRLNDCDFHNWGLYFFNNDSIKFTHECWAYSQSDSQERFVFFHGKKYTSQVPASLMGIEDENQENTSNYSSNYVKIYPNPTKKILNIELENIAETETEITITNIRGKTVLKSKFNTNKHIIDMSQFNKGIYIIRLTNNSYTVTKKIINL